MDAQGLFFPGADWPATPTAMDRESCAIRRFSARTFAAPSISRESCADPARIPYSETSDAGRGR
jgi:hypothetical protein